MSSRKSLEQVWQQIQAQRIAESQRSAAQERALHEQRERSRQEYIQRMRMYEKVGTSTPTTSSSAAGGGRIIKPSVVSSGQSILYYSYNDVTFNYFIYNFESDSLTDIKSIELPNSPSIYPVTRGGFLLESYNNSNYKLFFLNLNGEIIWQDITYDDNSSNLDIEVFSRYSAAYYLSSDGETWKLEVFDENSNQKSFTFNNYIEGGGYSYDDVWSNGFVVRELVGDIEKFYIINFEEGTSTLFYEIDTNQDFLSVYQYAFSDKIFTRKSSLLLEVFNSSGVKISEFDIESEFETTNWYLDTFTFLDANGSFIIIGYEEDNNDHTVIFFSGVSNLFSYKKISNDFNIDYEIENQKSYISTSDYDPKGSALILFYDNSNEINYVDYYDEAYLLPIWATDEQLRDLYTFSSSKGIVDVSGLATTRSEDYINLIIDNYRGELYLFSDNSSGGNDIGDGGDDMYDTGNIIRADDIQIEYTHTQYEFDNDVELNLGDYVSDGVVATGSVFGASSSAEYFTNLYPGLFVLAAQNTEVDKFEISGGLGADSEGQVDSLIYEKNFNSSTYSVFVKRVWDAQDPSVNHIIIVNGASSSITQTISEDTDNDEHILTGLASAGVTEIYYLLLALKGGAFLDNDKVEIIANQFLQILSESSDINELLTNLNSNYSNITDSFTTSDENYSILRLNRQGQPTTVLPTNISKSFEYYDLEKGNTKTLISFERQVTVEEEGFGWDDLSDVEDRLYYSLSKAVDSDFNSAVDNSLKLVMKDVVNDQYWAIQFTEWGSDIDANFAWTRQLIVGGTFSGEVISFTFSGWESGEADVISPGVLEIKRSLFGELYNSALEGESNYENPKGTLWNSELTYLYGIDEYQFTIIGTDGTVIDSIVKGDSNNYTVEGKTIIVEDEVFSKTWVSNAQNGGEFQLLNEYYTSFEDANNISNELGLRPGYILLNSGLKYKFVSEDSISPEVIVPSTGEIFTKVDRSDIFYNGFFISTLDETNYNLYFYDTNGNLIDKKTIPSSSYDDYFYGKRATVRFSLEGLENSLIFNGERLIEVNTNLDSLSIYINDYNWWND